MWEAIWVAAAVLGAAIFGSVTTIVLEEISDVPDWIRAAVGGSGTQSFSARIARLEARLGALERKVPRTAA
jgi:hypothetical protein